jgi:acyl-CoA thioesterase
VAAGSASLLIGSVRSSSVASCWDGPPEAIGPAGRSRARDEGIVSLDHALWPHRAERSDEWFVSDRERGRTGLFRATMSDRDGRVLASMAEELWLAPS